MGSQRSKEDEVQKISTSAFVTNFPDQFTAKELWNTCKQYGYVVDAFIPNRRSKAGKMFGFVRFIKVFDAERLQASSDFIIDERVTWVELEGIPLKMWSENTFKRIAYRWGVLLHVDDHEESCFHRKRVWINTIEENNEVDEYDDGSLEIEPNGDNLNNGDDVRGDSEIDEVPDTIFKEKLSNSNGDESSVKNKEMRLEDPFNIYDLLKTQKIDNKKGSKDTDSLKYPPGFTPQDDIEDCEVQSIERNVPVDERDEGTHNIHKEVEASRAKKSDSKKNSKGGGMQSVCSGHFKNAKPPHSGGFILLLMDEMVKVDYDVTSSLRRGALQWVWRRSLSEIARFHKYATKIDKLDRFLISESLMSSCPNISSITLDRFLSDHRPILLRESKYDYGPIPFLFFHYWFEVDGFVKLVEETWNKAPGDTSNAILNLMKKLKNQLAIRDVLVEGNWIETPALVKSEFLFHFKSRFQQPQQAHLNITMDFPRNLSSIQQADVEIEVINEEIKRAVGIVGFYKIIAKILANQLVIVLGDIVNEVHLAFVADRQIFDSPFILNELFQWCKSKKKQSMIFKVDFEKAFDSVRWNYLDDVLKILVLEKSGAVGFKAMERLEYRHYRARIGFLLSYIGFRINMSKSKLMGISVDEEKVDQAASKIGCVALKSLFSYLGSKVGGTISRIQSWNEIVDSMIVRLSKWKMKTLSTGRRLTLLKSVLRSMSIYHMSIFKVPMKLDIVHEMEIFKKQGIDFAALFIKVGKWEGYYFLGGSLA
nr:RNA-directed DNA polymerase, eukaryota, reverse transcriptase zinc-binding domain protein [Tanacetum cinerariifolium]